MYFGIEDHIAYLEQSEKGGQKACQFTSGSAESVAAYKSSFAGPQPSIIPEIASVVERQLESFQRQEESKSETSSCPSLNEETPTNPPKKTGIDPPKSQKLPEPSPTSIPPNKSDMLITSDAEPERKVGNDP